MRRPRASALALLMLVVSLLLGGCSSPNRGRWGGTFDGSVTGTVEFEINTRGTRLRGRMEGTTSDGQPFRAELEGSLRRDFLDAGFEGNAGTAFGLPLGFEGEMLGSLANGTGTGEWTAVLDRSGLGLGGSWTVERLAN